MISDRENPSAAITRQIQREIRIALKGIGAREDQLKRFRRMSAMELHDLITKLDADPYFQAFVGSWGDTLEDDDVLECLKRWNAGSKVV